MKSTRNSNLTRKTVREAQAKHEELLMKEFKTKPKPFYNYVRQKQKVKVGISQLRKEDRNLTETDLEAAEELSKFFQSVFTKEPQGDTPKLDNQISNDLKDVEFTSEDVAKELNKLSTDKSPGPDKLHLRILKECS